jgi:alpha-D-ribose 1-methylphosphonate 5-triphosphate synthase subunit PhnG
MDGPLRRAAPGWLGALLDALGPRPAFEWLRRPEIGTVMLRGRMGATGGPFNLGR